MNRIRPRLGRHLHLLVLVWAASPIAAQVPLGNEFELSAIQDRGQENPTVCADGRGRFFAVWNASDQTKTWGRSFSSEGVPASQEQLLAALEGEYGFDPTCTVDFRGKGAVLWAYLGLEENSVAGRLLENLAPLESPVLQPEPGPGGAIPAVTSLEDGSYVAAWTRVNVDYSIDLVMQRMDSGGSPLGPHYDLATGLQYGGFGRPYARVAPLGGGAFVAAWTGQTDESAGYDVWAQTFSSALAPLGAPFLVSEMTENDQFDPAVASDGGDRFVVAWDSLDQDGVGDGVFGRLFNSRGTPLGSEFQISSAAPSSQWWPAVSMDRSGTFAVAFASVQESEDTREDVFLRLYNASGQAVGGQQLVNQQIPYEQRFPSVALSDSGQLIVAWQSQQVHEGGDLSEDVLGRRYAIPCLENERTLCLQGGRFAVRAFWKIADGTRGTGHSLPLTEDSGGFWFFWPDNFEVLVKVLDGCGVNGNYWLYAAGLTDVEVDLVVSDSWTGTSQLYSNVLGQSFQPIQEVSRFPTCTSMNPHVAPVGSSPPTKDSGEDWSKAPDARRPAVSAAGTNVGTSECTTGGTMLCLGGGRFRATVVWQDFFGNVGAGIARQNGEDSGLFWFFWPENLELAIKVLDGCGVNDRYWVYTSGLTNVAVTILVEDLQTGATWSYSNPLGHPFPPVLDSSALSVCL